MPFLLGIVIIIILGLISGLSSLIEDIKYKIKPYLDDRKSNKSISLKDEELNNLLTQVVSFFIISAICGIIGYLLAKYTSADIKKYIILGICCPSGYVVLNKVTEFLYKYFQDLYELLSLVTIGIFALICNILKIIISAYVGIIVFPILIIYFFIALIIIVKEK